MKIISDWYGNMRWLKSLVIGLGILIVLGVIALGFGFYKKSTDPGWKLFGAEPEPVSAQPFAPGANQVKRTPFKPFGTISLNLAEGCVITNVTPKRRYVYLMIGPTPACNQMVIVDVKSGVVLGTVKPRP